MQTAFHMNYKAGAPTHGTHVFYMHNHKLSLLTSFTSLIEPQRLKEKHFSFDFLTKHLCCTHLLN